ncbi:MAG: serine hydroxymethyltransferase, partial [Bacteroidota bacterium]
MNPRAPRFTAGLRETDPELRVSIERERERQELGLELIASENYASRAVME